MSGTISLFFSFDNNLKTLVLALHRWTTAEFSQWCQGIAHTYGYSVELGGVGEGKPRKKPRRHSNESLIEESEEARHASHTAVFLRLEGDELVQSLQTGVNALSLQSSSNVTPSHPDLEIDFIFPAIDFNSGQGVDIVELTKEVIVDLGERMEKQMGASHLYKADIWTVWMCPDVRIVCRGRIDDWLQAIGITFGEDTVHCQSSISLQVEGRGLRLICQVEEEQDQQPYQP